jgi:glutathione S-transferase
MMACYAEVPFTIRAYALDESFNRDEWHVQDKPSMRAKNPFMNLPYVRDGDVLVTQSNACMSFLGRKFGMWGNSETELITCETLLCELMDLRNSVVGFSYPATKAKAQDWVNSCRNGSLAKIDAHLASTEFFAAARPFILGTRVSAPDFHLFELLLQIKLASDFFECDVFFTESMLNLELFFLGFGKLPKMQKYLTSPMASMPLNNLMANFGSLGDGSKWEAGKALPAACDKMSF